MSSSFGRNFRVTSFGESHSKALGVVIDGCPAGLEIDLNEIQGFLDERKPGQNAYVTQRKESDRLECLSGIENGMTLGSPICFVVYNEDARPGDYSELSQVFRPSHGDYTTYAKYGLKSKSGGGRSSVRETLARVAAAGVARRLVASIAPDLEVLAFVESVKDIKCYEIDSLSLDRVNIYRSPVRCPHAETSEKIMALIKKTKEEGDSLGGKLRCVIKNVPPGLGEPVFDKLDAVLAQAMMSIPAVKGFELGKGFEASSMKGSEHNDPFVLKEGKLSTLTNHSGGIQAGISNGEEIDFRLAFKPTSTIFKAQQTVDLSGKERVLELKKGRHDPCVLPRAVPIVEAMAYLVIADFMLRQKTQFT